MSVFRAVTGYLWTICVVASLLAGCNTIRGFPDAPKTTDVSSPDPGWELSVNAIRAYNAETDEKKKKLLRDGIIDARITAIDEAFGKYERQIYKEDVASGLVTDWITLGLTAGTTVVGAASTKTAFGAASTALQGGTASFEKRALFDKTLPALLAQMVGARETIRAQIHLSKKLDTAEYTWASAEGDIQRFAFAGSLIGAIASVTQDAGQKATSAKQQVQDITTGKFQKTTNSALLQIFWKPNGNVDSTHEEKLKAWMTDNAIGTDAGMITMFVNSEIFEAARAKAVKDLSLDKSSDK